MLNCDSMDELVEEDFWDMPDGDGVHSTYFAYVSAFTPL